MTLQMYLKLGVQIKGISKIIKFEQRPFVKSFVELMAGYRSDAVNEGSKLRPKLFKNIPNATYGKTVQRARGLSK